MPNGRRLLFLAAAVAALLVLGARSARTDLGSLSDAFYRCLFRREEIRAVFGLEEEEAQAVCSPAAPEAQPVFGAAAPEDARG